MLYNATSVSCNPFQFFGLTTANQLALGENRVFNDENLRALFLTDLEKGIIHEPPEPLLSQSMMRSIVVINKM